MATAGAYENLPRTEIPPGIDRVKGYKGAYPLRRNVADAVEFATLTLWGSMEAIRAFAGEGSEVAVAPPEARKLLSGFDGRSLHFETIVEPEQDRTGLFP